MGDLQGRKVFKVFNQDFIVDERYTVTKELGQGAYGIVWSVCLSINYITCTGSLQIWEKSLYMSVDDHNTDSDDVVPLRTPRPTRVWLSKR